jgi:hypothetical protein
VQVSVLRSSAVDRMWGGVSSELVRSGKRREIGEKEGVRWRQWHHTMGEGRERGREKEGGGVSADRQTAPGRQRPETSGRERRGTAMPRC